MDFVLKHSMHEVQRIIAVCNARRLSTTRQWTNGEASLMAQHVLWSEERIRFLEDRIEKLKDEQKDL